MSEKFTRKNFLQRVIGGVAALTLTKTEAKPALNQITTIVEPPPAPPVKTFMGCKSYSGIICTGSFNFNNFSGTWLHPDEETLEKHRKGKY